jgi:nucleoside-diphosphate-sugar epimerase
MNLLVTGASGFLGRNLLLRAPADWHIVALYNTDSRFPHFVAGLDRPNIVAAQCDLASTPDVARFVREHGAEWGSCLFLAAKVDIPWSVRQPKDDLLANTIPVLNLLEVIRVEKLVYFSSGAVYDGHIGEVGPDMPVAPTLPYATSKLASEHYVRFFQERRRTVEKCLIVRFFGAYGPYEPEHKLYTRLINAFGIAKHDHYTIYGDGTNLIDAVYVDDAVEAVRRMLTGNHWNATVNLAGGHPRRIDELVQAVGAALGVHSVKIQKSGIANERNEFWGSVGELRKLLGFQPTIELADGVRRFRDFLARDVHEIIN